MRWSACLAAVLVLAAAPAPAQNPTATNPTATNPTATNPTATTATATTPTRIRGTVEKLDGHTLTVKERDGHAVAVTLADNFAVAALARKTLADVKPNDYIASTGVTGKDGKLHCVELRIFPEALRGAAEGQFPWDSMPEATMTNATVTGMAKATDGEMIKVTFKGKESEFVVGPQCQVFGYTEGDASLLKPGAAIFAVAQKRPDGTLTAARITAEKNGVKPPM